MRLLRLPSSHWLVVAITVACETPGLWAQGVGPARPVADHHGHLQSSAVWRLFNGQLPVAPLPADLDQVLRGFERGWQARDNKITLAELFTDDGLFQWGDDWLRGRPAIRMMLLGNSGPLRMRAQVFDADDSLGHIAGACGFYRDMAWVDQGSSSRCGARGVDRGGSRWPHWPIRHPRRHPPRDPYAADARFCRHAAGRRALVGLPARRGVPQR